MYSDMSMRTMARSSSKRNSARARASSVLPTPVGPRNRNDPIGRFGSARPAPARRGKKDRPVRRVRIGEPRTRTADRVRDRRDRGVLADDALVQQLLEVDQ